MQNKIVKEFMIILMKEIQLLQLNSNIDPRRNALAAWMPEA
ncbi:hypothetical protein ACOTJQ_24590 [Achromobacter xylosoxidans]|nr:hypothetical protein [Pseudomonas aeruginosa]WJQ95408.1 hypothetical protein JTM23_023515 [Pseudomonas aeruginosa]